MGVNEQNKEQVQSTNLYFKSCTSCMFLLKGFSKGQYLQEIAQNKKIRKSKLNYHKNKLLALNLIILKNRSNFSEYILTEKGHVALNQSTNSSLGVEQKAEHLKLTANPVVHSLGIKMPIIFFNEDANFTKEIDYKETPMNNWIQKDFYIPSLKCNVKITTKSIIIYPDKFTTSKIDYKAELNNTINRTVFSVGAYFKNNYKVVFDMFNQEFIDHETAMQDKKLHEKEGNGTRKTINLGHKVVINDTKTNLDAKVWADNSHEIREIESNDPDFIQSLVDMPSRFERIEKALEYHALNQVSHVGMIKEIRILLAKLNEKL